MVNNKWLHRFFPFLSWFPITPAVLRDDLMAGITGALVLVPKAMAYAQLSGLPVYFGLYTAFVPALLGALWGSSRQLATGPVAVISLMTAAALAPIAVPLTDEYIALALLLTLLVGIIQLSLGVLKLGTIVNFVSHPVILGFMNAAAIIIALSQLDMLLGLPKGRSDSFLKDIWEMFSYLPQTHFPTLMMSAFALALILGLKKISPLFSKLNVLIAVVVTTLVSYGVGFSHKAKEIPSNIADPTTRELVTSYATAQIRLDEIKAEITAKSSQLRAMEKADDLRGVADLSYHINLLKLEVTSIEKQGKEHLYHINRLQFERAPFPEKESATLYLVDTVPAGVETDGRRWHVKKIEKGVINLTGGGDVVGTIPQGLPAFKIPTLSLDAIAQLLSAALIIALVAFMECISMAKALSTKSKQRINPNQELIGQGMANIGGAFFQSYPATGSFTGSAINLQAGAKTGFAMVFNSIFVAITLLFLTAYLYYLPKATLAVIIVLAVTGLVTPQAIKHAWKANKLDGMIAVTTFIVTLLAAPHLDKGIIVGTALALMLFLYRTMKPRVAKLGRFSDGTLRDIKVNPTLPTSEHVIVMRFDGQLYFANVSYFEETIIEALAAHPKAKYLLVISNGINQLDATGEEVIQHLKERLHDNGVTLVFSGLKKQVIDVMRNTGLFDQIGRSHIFATEEQALAAIYEWLGEAGKNDPFYPTKSQYALWQGRKEAEVKASLVEAFSLPDTHREEVTTPPLPVDHFDRILLVTDGSEYSNGAERETIKLAQKVKRRLFVMSVVRINPEYESLAPQLFEKEQSETIANLKRVKAAAQEAGVDCEFLLRYGEEVYEQVVDEAERSQMGIIVMGRRGKGGMMRAMVGGTTTRVISHTSSNVLVVPRNAHINGNLILLAADGSHYSEVAAVAAIQMAQYLNAPINVVSVVEQTEKQAEGTATVERIRSLIAPTGITVNGQVTVGKPAESIVETAKAQQADLIVVGTRGLTGLEKILMGSVSDRVIVLAECAVLVVEA